MRTSQKKNNELKQSKLEVEAPKLVSSPKPPVSSLPKDSVEKQGEANVITSQNRVKPESKPQPLQSVESAEARLNPPSTSTVSHESRIEPTSVRASWLNYTAEALLNCWMNATNIGVILPGNARMVVAIRTEAPNVFIAVFPAGCTQQQDYCEKEKVKIAAALSKNLRSDVELRLAIDTSLTPPTFVIDSSQEPCPTTSLCPTSCGSRLSSTPDLQAQSSFYHSNGREEPHPEKQEPQLRANFHELTIAFNQNEVVQELKELFGAELADVKPPTPSESKPKPRYYFQ